MFKSEKQVNILMIVITSMIMLVISIFVFMNMDLTVSAQTNVYQGTFNQKIIDGNSIATNNYTFSSDSRFCFYINSNAYYLYTGDSVVNSSWNNNVTYNDDTPSTSSTGSVTYNPNRYQYFTTIQDNDVITVPLFNNKNDAMQYLLNGDTMNQTNKPYDMLSDSIPNGIDLTNNATYLTDYKLTGFLADYEINAKWTGVQYPGGMQTYFNNGSMELLDEKIYISLGYCNKNYPTQIAYTKWIPTGVSTSQLNYSFNVNDYKPTDSSDYYLFSVGFYPCIQYKTRAGMGTSIQYTTWSYGSKNMIYFNYKADTDDISGSKIVVDSGNSNNSTNTDLIWSDDENIMVTDLDSAMKKFVNLIDSVSATGQKVSQAFSIFFSFLPFWVTGAVSALIIVIVILRIVGR